MLVFILEQVFHIHWFVGDLGKVADVAPVCVDKCYIWRKRGQTWIAQYGILPVHAEVGLVKICLNTIGKQKQIQLLHDFIGCGAAKDGNLLFKEVY